jgi:hypothetical protein
MPRFPQRREIEMMMINAELSLDCPPPPPPPAASPHTQPRRGRRRRSPMTDASPPAPESAEQAAAPESADGKRRSRWGAKTEDAAGISEAPAAARKRSRWGSKPAQTSDPVTLAVQLGIPLATLQQMTAEQQQMLPVIKSKIDEIDLQCAWTTPPPRVHAPAQSPPMVRQAEASRLWHGRRSCGAALAVARTHLRQKRPACE